MLLKKRQRIIYNPLHAYVIEYRFNSKGFYANEFSIAIGNPRYSIGYVLNGKARGLFKSSMTGNTYLVHGFANGKTRYSYTLNKKYTY